MVARVTLVVCFFLASLSYCQLNKRGELYDMVGEWIVTSVLDYPTDIYLRVDKNDVHFQYGSMNEKRFTLRKSANMGAKFTQIKTKRNVNNQTYPNENEVDNAFKSVTNYEFLDYGHQELVLKDALGRSIFHLVNKDEYKKRSQRNARRGRQGQATSGLRGLNGVIELNGIDRNNGLGELNGLNNDQRVTTKVSTDNIIEIHHSNKLGDCNQDCNCGCKIC